MTSNKKVIIYTTKDFSIDQSDRESYNSICAEDSEYNESYHPLLWCFGIRYDNSDKGCTVINDDRFLEFCLKYSSYITKIEFRD